MKKKLPFLKRKATQVFLLLFTLFSINAFTQNLVRYPLSTNLNPAEGPAPGMQISGVPMIKYMDPPIQVTPDFGSNYLQFKNNGDELVLTFDATNYQDMSVQFKGGIGVILAGASGNIKVFLKIGSGTETKIDEANISASLFGSETHDFAPPLTGANNQSLVQIRIVGTSSSFGIFSYFGIQNLRIVSDNTKMTVRRNATGYSDIPYNADASVNLDTDFGSRFTNDTNNDQTSQDKQYIIKNTGSRPLKISSLTISPADQGFSIISAPAATVAAGGTTTFNVRFSPQNQGLKIANIIMNSNAIPNNPFSFQVKGNSKSCNLEPVPIVVQNFETTGSNLKVATILGNPNITGGNSKSPTPNTVSALFPTNTNLYATGSNTRSLFVNGKESKDENNVTGTGETTLEFGPIDLTGQQEVSVNFEVAAFGKTSSNSGVNGYDYVLLQVMNPDGSWSDEIRLNGSGSTGGEYDSRSYIYGFGQTLIPESNYDGVLDTRVNSSTMKYGKFKLNIPASALTSNFKFRIKARTGQSRGSWITTGLWSGYYPLYNRNLWLIDNVHVDAGNAKVKTWNGTGWTGENTSRPGDREKAVFAGNYNFTAANNDTDLSLCECAVNSGATLTIPTGKALTVRNKIINNGNGSNFIIKDGGNLLQVEDGAINTGNITAEKVFTFSSGRQQYNFVSSPTVDTNVKSIYTGVLDNSLSALYYIESNDRFGVSGGNYIAGRALALKEKSTGTEGGTSGNPAKFQGVPFNGIVNYPLAFTDVTHGYNLVGNPYPSNLDIENLYNSNTTKIDATFYFWDNRGNTQYTQQGSGYSGDNYAKYNAVAATGTGSGTKATGAPDATRVPNRYVKVGTGFLVQAKSAGKTLDFNNTMRSSDNSGPGFLGKSTQNEMKDRYWLTLKTPTDMEFMNAVVYLSNGSKAIGPEDTETFGGSDDIFTIVDDKNLNIQGRDQFEINDRLDLGVSLFQTGMHTISIYDAEGIFANGQSIYLKDKLTGTITNLSQGSYTFEANKGVTNARFEIIYKPETVLVTDSKVKDAIVVYRDSDHFVVKAPKIIATVEVYDLSGKMITVLKANNNQVVLNAAFFTKGMYVLRIKTIDGEITNKKIVKQ